MSLHCQRVTGKIIARTTAAGLARYSIQEVIIKLVGGMRPGCITTYEKLYFCSYLYTTAANMDGLSVDQTVEVTTHLYVILSTA